MNVITQTRPSSYNTTKEFSFPKESQDQLQVVNETQMKNVSL